MFFGTVTLLDVLELQDRVNKMHGADRDIIYSDDHQMT
jgi:hypothetical protein